MKKDYLNEFSNYCWIINIEIPDDAVVAETIEYIKQRVNKTLQKQNISNAHREFLTKRFYIATKKDSVRTAIKETKECSAYSCVILAFNAKLSQAECDRLGVISFEYISWGKKAWNRAKNEMTITNLIKLLKCLGRNLVDLGCQALISMLFKGVIPL